MELFKREPAVLIGIFFSLLIYGAQLIIDAGLDASGVLAGIIPILSGWATRFRVSPVEDDLWSD